jgi:signal transduction histidine kinase
MRSLFPARITSLVTLIVLLALLPALALIIYSAWAAARAEIQLLEQSALRFVNNCAAQQRLHVDNTRLLLQGLALQPPVTRLDIVAANKLLKELLGDSEVYAAIRLCDENGDTLAASSASLPPLSDEERKQALRVTREDAFQAVVYPAGESFSFAGINCMLPLKSAGGEPLVLSAMLFLNIWDGSLQSMAAGENIHLRIAGREHGPVLDYPLESSGGPDARIWENAWTMVRRSAQRSAILHLDDDSSLSFAKLYFQKDSPMSMAIMLWLSEDELYADKNDEILLYSAMLLLVALLALLIAGRLSNITLITPVKKILGVAGRLKEGKLGARVEQSFMARELRVLADSLNSMAESLQGRNAELEAARDAADAANKAKTDFLATMSHEIRTPMNAILGMAYLTRQSELTPQQRDYVDTIQSEAEKLLAVINDILNFSKIEAGRFSLERIPFDLEAALGGIAVRATLEAGKKGLTFHSLPAPDLPRYLLGDPSVFTQIVGNIVLNAIKFTPSGEVRLRCFAEHVHGRSLFLICDIVDTAGGMDSFERELLFPDVEPEGRMATFDGGTGLNLSITRKLTRLLRGTISVHAEKDVGTTVRLRLPFEECDGLDEEADAAIPNGEPLSVSVEIEDDERFSGPSPEAETPDPEVLRNARVLLAEDNPINQQVAEELLRAAGAETSIAANGLEALTLLDEAPRGYPFHVVLMDLQMPELDGYNATRRIRLDERFRKLPIIAMTAHDLREEWPHCREIGMNDFITKPLDAQNFLAVVSKWVKRGEDL